MLRMFISYCHANSEYESETRKTLEPLVNEGRIQMQSDRDLIPGQRIRRTNDRRLLQSDIVLFLITRDFIASQECLREWELAKKPTESGTERRRIPLIVTPCSWKDLLKDEDLLVIPQDATPLSAYSDPEKAWAEIYERIKCVLSDMETNCKPRSNFRRVLEENELTGDREVGLSANYEFGKIQSYERTGSANLSSIEKSIENLNEILKLNMVIIHGEPMSGKTALAKMLCITQIEHDRPVLYVDARRQTGRWTMTEIERLFHDQFIGYWDYWINHSDRLIVVDDLTESKEAVKFLHAHRSSFPRVIFTMDTDIYRIYYRTEEKISSYSEMQIKEINQWQQEQLIRKTLAETTGRNVTDGEVDVVERRINEIVDTRLIPRYPFYVLSIIQALQVFMPQDAQITSHAHCYYVFILGRLVKAGVEKDDGSINACLNFAEHLAKAIFDRKEASHDITSDFFKHFIESYRKNFVISDEQIRRMHHPRYGILDENEGFRIRYMEFYFLGRFLARNSMEHASIIQKMCERSEIERYHLTLLFVIHHAENTRVLEDITLNTMCALENVQPAVLNRRETGRFQTLVTALRGNLLTDSSIEDNRRETREVEAPTEASDTDTHNEYPPNEILKVLKNNRILGQVLRTRHGSIEKSALRDIVEAVADGGLRIVNIFLGSTDEIEALAHLVQARLPGATLETIKKELTWFSFFWTMTNVEMIVEAVNKGEVREILEEIVLHKNTPAYDLIFYFSLLDNATELTSKLNDHFDKLCKSRRDPFIQRVASIRTQFYMNTHNSKRNIEQRFCESMGIKYIYRHIKE